LRLWHLGPGHIMTTENGTKGQFDQRSKHTNSSRSGNDSSIPGVVEEYIYQRFNFNAPY